MIPLSAWVALDGIDGRAHYLKLPVGADLAELPIGSIVEARPSGQESPIDRDISSLARNGVYRTEDHLARLQQRAASVPQSTVDTYVRRLEALRRVGIVECAAEGVWRVPSDLVSRAQAHDAKKTAGMTIELRSHLPLGSQEREIGATWLDRQLVSDGRGLSRQGFGAQVHEAMQNRVVSLVRQGLAERRGQRVILARNLLATLRDRELVEVGKAIQDQTGQTYRPLRDNQRTTGVYRRSLQLASGRFAMLDDGSGFSLVPWRPVIEQRLGQTVTALVRGSHTSWEFGRKRGASIG